ncbi:MAG: ankyrin repeat domain-containing protein [archaeon]|nr:ankyrin repeat domain-containing protein [archaeon]
MPAGRILPLIRVIVCSEFERNFRRPGSILRGNCVASKLMATYSRQVSVAYLQAAVGPIVKALCSSDAMSFEIDPSKLRGIADNQLQMVLQANQSCLLAKSKDFINHLISSPMIKALPRQVCSIAYFTAEYSKLYASDRVSALVGGFLMLRLINPSLVTPDAWDICPKGSVSPSARRNLTLLSKVIQNLSNNILFGSKEEYMVPMNPFIEEYAPKLVEFYNTIIHDPLAGPEREAWADCKNPVSTEESDPAMLEEKNLLLLHTLLYTYRGKLLDILHEELQKPPEERDFTLEEGEKFFTLLDELGTPARDKAGSSAPSLDLADSTISFLTKTEKSGVVTKRLHNHASSAKRKPRSVWMVATSHFLHFLDSTEEKKANLSFPIEDIVVQIGTAAEASMLGEAGANYLTLGSDEGLAVITCHTVSEASDWHNCLLQLKSRRVQAAPIREKLTPLELRIQTHITGKKQPYELSFSAFKSDHGLAMFVFCVRAFGGQYLISHSWEDFLILADSLAEQFPRFIFPTFPPLSDPHTRHRRSRRGGKGESSGSGGSGIGAHLGSESPRRKLSNSGIIKAKPQSSRRHLSKSGLTTSTSMDDAESVDCGIESSSADNLIGYDQDGRPTRALILAAKFLKAFVTDLSANILTSQCDRLFSFLELDSPFRAVLENSLEHLQYLQQTGTNFNVTNRDGFSPLHLAVLNGNQEMLGHLKRFGAQLDFPDKGGNSPLLLAIKRDKADMIDTLIELGADTTITNRALASPLHAAAEVGNLSLVQRLLALGSSARALDFKKKPPLVLAVQSKHRQIAELLLPISPLDYVDAKGNSLLHFAVRSKLSTILEKLLAIPEFSPAKTNIHSVTPLHLAARSGQQDIARHLLAHSRAADAVNLPDADGTTPVCLAVIKGHPDIVRLLAPISDLAHKLPGDQSILHLAVSCGAVESSRLLVEAGAPIDALDAEHRTPVHLAIAIKQKAVALLLISLGADLNIKDARQRSPLHTASITGDSDIIDAMLKTGRAQINVPDEEGCLPLHISIWAHHEPATRILIAAGSDVNQPDDVSQETPLHLAANFGLAPIVELLVAKGANVQAPQKDGHWPIHLAALNGDDSTIHAMMIRAEIASSILANAPNSQGRTPIQLALDRRNESAAVALAKHGANFAGMSIYSKQLKANLEAASSS